MDKSWLIEGVLQTSDADKTIRVCELPPLMKYASFLKRLDALLNYYPGVKIANNSRDNVDILLKYSGDKDGWVAFNEAIEKSTKMLVTETPVFVKDGLVLEYDRIEDYIEDFKYRRSHLRVKRAEHFLKEANDELEFAQCKEKYLMYMLETQRKESEVDKFLNTVTKNTRVKRRLESFYLKSLNAQELERTQKEIAKLKGIQLEQEKELSDANAVLALMVDTAVNRGTTSKTSSAMDLFNDEDEIDGIAVWNGDKDEEDETINQ